MKVYSQCVKCLEYKEEQCFSYRFKVSGVRHTVCKDCHKLVARTYYDLNLERSKELSSTWAKENNSRRRAIAAEHVARKRYKKICSCCSRDDFLSFYQQRQDGEHVDHIVGLGEGGIHCCKNLQVLTASDHGVKSCLEKYSRQEPKRGDSHPGSKLNSKQVLLIRDLKGEFTGTFLAKFFAVTHTTIYGVWNGKQWRSI